MKEVFFTRRKEQFFLSLFYELVFKRFSFSSVTPMRSFTVCVCAEEAEERRT